MKRVFFSILIGIFLTFSESTAYSSESGRLLTLDSTDQIGIMTTMTVHSNIEGVRVFLDSMTLGSVPVDSIEIPPGKHILRFIHPEDRNWYHKAIVETILVKKGEHLRRIVKFHQIYYVSSNPFGAVVSRGDSILGTTPLFLTFESPNINFVKLSKEGFGDTVITISDIGRNNDRASVFPLKIDNRSRSPLFLSSEQSKNTLPIYITTGATVISGIAAALFKIKADNYYEDYRQTGSPARLEQVRKLDVISGVSLALSEISLLALTYYLLSQ